MLPKRFVYSAIAYFATFNFAPAVFEILPNGFVYSAISYFAIFNFAQAVFEILPRGIVYSAILYFARTFIFLPRQIIFAKYKVITVLYVPGGSQKSKVCHMNFLHVLYL